MKNISLLNKLSIFTDKNIEIKSILSEIYIESMRARKRLKNSIYLA